MEKINGRENKVQKKARMESTISMCVLCAAVGCLIIAPLHLGFCFTLAAYLSASFHLDTLLNVQASRKC